METCREFHLEVKISSLSIWICYSLLVFRITLLDLQEEMAGNSQSAVKIMNSHPSKIDVVKFDGTDNFDMWRCEVIDANGFKTEDVLFLEEKP